MKKQISQVMRMFPWVILAVVGGLLASGCATTQTDQGQFSDPPKDLFPEATNAVAGTNAGGFAAVTRDGDRFQIGDQVTVKFSGTVEQILPHEERIKDDGTITLSLIGAVKAAGKTPGDLQKEIHALYVPDYYKRLTITITGEQRVYSVGGQVKAPGRQVYISATTVTKAIQSAGDFTDFAAKRRVVLTRADGKRFIIDCKKAAKDPALDLPVYPGDKIEVDQRGILDTFD